GKSSLLRLIYRVLRPDAGLITLDGDDLWQMDTRRAAQTTAAVTQERASDFDFSVHEIVLMGRTPHKGLFDGDTPADFAIVEAALRQVNLTAYAGRSFRTLSGGEKQRVLVARALAQQAKLLVLDEPTNHLDIRHQLEILGLVKRLGVTTLAALHDLNLAAQYCERIFLLDAGKVVASGGPEQVLQPELIRQVYGVDAHVERHPLTKQLVMTFFPLTERKLPERKLTERK
ncbi:MAG TPA: ABC transporter ATP-binding protein, partial [Caldilineaceae bacterium]|nr:ABC transporter ATP-binding protein [Caldilineaceae bacterium]